jgi:chemotaxis protein histidine kinase CheA
MIHGFFRIVMLMTLQTCCVLAAPVDFQRQIRPLLQERCVSCHGAIRQHGGLRLDAAQLIRTGGDTGPAVIAGNPNDSPLMARVTSTDDAIRMPPVSEGVALNQAELELLQRWIADGAVAADETIPEGPSSHWAYQVPVRPPLPSVTDTAETQPSASSSTGSSTDRTSPAGGIHPIDAFLQAVRSSQGLEPSGRVSDELWLRRVTLDLTGLPPMIEEQTAFKHDISEKRFETVIDRLLSSPQHGERWARHWMDVWRYSDWYGLGEELRFSHYHIWRWRDWIIESLNTDLGYDQMIITMLAADEVAPEDPEALRATGFLVRNWDIFNRNKWLDNTIQHTSRAFLGITMQCAKCHDHKFDPISQKEYYQLRAIFEPYQVRIDRVPGQADRNKDGLVRVFDDFLDAPTYLFVRGDENTPDKEHPLTPALPAIFGTEFISRTINLPRQAYAPDKRDFIIQEARDNVVQSVQQAKAALDTAQQLLTTLTQQEQETFAARQTAQDAVNTRAMAGEKPDPATTQNAVAAERRHAEIVNQLKHAQQVCLTAEAQLAAAQASADALEAVLKAEQFEDSGGKSAAPEVWANHARNATAAQRLAALMEATATERRAQQQLDQALRVLDGATAALAAAQQANDAAPKDKQPKDESLKQQIEFGNTAVDRAAKDVVAARTALAAAAKKRAETETVSASPLTTEYTPRAQVFHRAKLTYRDTPSTAPYQQTSSGRRLAFANWVASRHNPLTARVAVNQIWMRHFGTPLVENVFDFGLRSQRPVHHELLDWLAVEFMESGWSMKHLHRLIVTSEAYHMVSSTSGTGDDRATRDPDNKYYWRMNVRRMEAEVIRDSLLLIANRLDPVMFGPEIPLESAEEGLRRTIYYRYSRDHRMKFLTMFDAAGAEECYRRSETIVPQQALALSNSKLALDRADDIAGAITTAETAAGQPGVSDAAFVKAAFRRVLNRDADDAELQASVSWLSEMKIPVAEARSAFIHVLINHNDFVTIR